MNFSLFDQPYLRCPWLAIALIFPMKKVMATSSYSMQRGLPADTLVIVLCARKIAYDVNRQGWSAMKWANIASDFSFT